MFFVAKWVWVCIKTFLLNLILNWDFLSRMVFFCTQHPFARGNSESALLTPRCQHVFNTRGMILIPATMVSIHYTYIRLPECASRTPYLPKSMVKSDASQVDKDYYLLALSLHTCLQQLPCAMARLTRTVQYLGLTLWCRRDDGPMLIFADYSLMGMKFPPIIAPFTLFTVLKVFKTFLFWNFHHSWVILV
jgi:hypothetical protein